MDFCCISCKLAIEVDGAVHERVEQAERDALRTAQLREWGYTVLRFRNEEITHDLLGVLETILNTAAALNKGYSTERAVR